MFCHLSLRLTAGPNVQPHLQHLRNLLRNGVMHRRGRMQRIVPKILLQLDTTLLAEVVLRGGLFVFAAMLRRIFVNGRLGVGSRVVHHFAEQGVRVEMEDGGVGMLAGQVGGQGEKALVPIRDGERRDGMAPLAGEGHAVQGRDVEDEEVAGAGDVKLCGMSLALQPGKEERSNEKYTRRFANLLEQKPIYSEKTCINLRAIIFRQWLIRTPSDIIDAKEGSKEAIRRIPPSSAGVVGDAIIRHILFMIESHEAVHGGAVAGHVVCLENAAVVGQCQVMDPFLANRRGPWERRVAERIVGRGLFLLRIEAGGGVGISTGSDG